MSDTPLILADDARQDSPGHCTTFGTYNLLYTQILFFSISKNYLRPARSTFTSEKIKTDELGNFSFTQGRDMGDQSQTLFFTRDFSANEKRCRCLQIVLHTSLMKSCFNFEVNLKSYIEYFHKTPI